MLSLSIVCKFYIFYLHFCSWMLLKFWTWKFFKLASVIDLNFSGHASQNRSRCRCKNNTTPCPSHYPRQKMVKKRRDTNHWQPTRWASGPIKDAQHKRKKNWTLGFPTTSNMRHKTTVHKKPAWLSW